MNYVNLTPHTITLNDGREFPASGIVSRVTVYFGDFEKDFCQASYGYVENLPKPEEGVVYIVSSMVLEAIPEERYSDVVAPASGHPEVIRENGQIKSVPGFVRKREKMPCFDPYVLGKKVLETMGYKVETSGFGYNSLNISVKDKEGNQVFTENIGE